jgi:hypothetical protein
MSNITRTLFGARIQAEQLLGLPHQAVSFTTLNEKFDIQAGAVAANNVIPSLGYFCIGMGGHRNMVGAENTPYPDDVSFSPEYGALYRHLPFIMRAVGEDLDTTTRSRYAMRKLVTVNGVNYIAYYLRRIDRTGLTVAMNHNTPVPGSGSTPPTVTVTPYVPTSANLNPVAPALPPTGAVTTDGSYLSTSTPLNLSISAAEQAELMNVGRILFDNERQVVISEIGLVAGVDQVVTSSTATGSVNYIEALQATLVAHVMTYYAMAFHNLGVEHSLEVGAIEPLLVTTTSP